MADDDVAMQHVVEYVSTSHTNQTGGIGWDGPIWLFGLFGPFLQNTTTHLH